MDRVLEVFLSIFYVHAQVCVDIVISLQYALRDMTDSYRKKKTNLCPCQKNLGNERNVADRNWGG